MKIGIIGAGRIGGTVGTLWAKASHEVLFSSRNPDALADLALAAGPNAHVGTIAEAAVFGEVVLLAIPWRNLDTLPAVELFAGKIVIDAMNHYGPTGQVIDLSDSTSSEEVAKRLPGARLVKAFNTMYFETLRTGGRADAENRLALFVAGDDDEAKAVVARLIEEIGFAPVDTGSLHECGRRQHPGAPIYNRPLTVEQACALLSAER